MTRTSITSTAIAALLMAIATPAHAESGKYGTPQNGAATEQHQEAVDTLDGQQTLCTERSGPEEECVSYDNPDANGKDVFTAKGSQTARTAVRAKNQPDQGARTVNTAKNADSARMSDKANCVKAWKNKGSDYYCGPKQRKRVEWKTKYTGSSSHTPPWGAGQWKYLGNSADGGDGVTAYVVANPEEFTEKDHERFNDAFGDDPDRLLRNEDGNCLSCDEW